MWLHGSMMFLTFCLPSWSLSLPDTIIKLFIKVTPMDLWLLSHQLNSEWWHSFTHSHNWTSVTQSISENNFAEDFECNVASQWISGVCWSLLSLQGHFGEEIQDRHCVEFQLWFNHSHAASRFHLRHKIVGKRLFAWLLWKKSSLWSTLEQNCISLGCWLLFRQIS